MLYKPLNEKLTLLVDLLFDGEFHDGSYLGEQLGVSRTAVWKLINKLIEYGIVIDSKKRMGYRLPGALRLLDANKITAQLSDKALADKVSLQIFESVDSTNNYLKVAEETPRWSMALAEQQLAGRGRLSRHWHSPFGQNIYFSSQYQPSKGLSELGGLSLVVALAIVSTLATVDATLPVYVKWPNDVMVGSGINKCAGTLLEILGESHGQLTVVIGIGINVNMSDPSIDLGRPWTSLALETNRTWDRNQLVARLIERLDEYLSRFDRLGLIDFLEEWRQCDCLQGQITTVSNAGELVTGRAQGINDNGHLIIETRAGETITVSSGDATLQTANCPN